MESMPQYYENPHTAAGPVIIRADRGAGDNYTCRDNSLSTLPIRTGLHDFAASGDYSNDG